MSGARREDRGRIEAVSLRDPLLWGLAVAAVAMHLSINLLTPYGIFRDELYYIACSKRPAFGYVDHPPLSIWMLTASRWVFGESLLAIRLLPALFSGLIVFVTGLITLRLGGRRLALLIAGTAVLLGPIFVAMHGVYSMNALDHLLWVLGAYVLLRIIDGAPPRWWLYLGLVIGLGSLNKIGMLWFAAGAMLAVLFTAELRRQLRGAWPWIGAAAAALLFLPYVLWNAANDFAHLEFIRNATMYKYAGLSQIDFIVGQLLILNPFAAPVWIGGLFYLVGRGAGSRYRALGIVFISTAAVLLVNGQSKAEYMAPAYPMVFAAGAVWLEAATSERLRWLRPVLPSALILTGLLLLPMAAPVLPVPAFVSYSEAIGVGHQNSESKELGTLPQFFADMHGWEDLAEAVSEVYLRLPPAEREHAVVFARNYGQAGAVEYFADRYALPPAISVHNNYWLWGYPEPVGTIIIIGGDEESHRSGCSEVIRAGEFRSEYCMPYENNQTLWICRGLRRPLEQVWRQEKHYM